MSSDYFQVIDVFQQQSQSQQHDSESRDSVGYPTLKPEQEKGFVSGNDVFVLLPTDYSKSLCFGLLPSVFDVLRGLERKSSVSLSCSVYVSNKDNPTVKLAVTHNYALRACTHN